MRKHFRRESDFYFKTLYSAKIFMRSLCEQNGKAEGEKRNECFIYLFVCEQWSQQHYMKYSFMSVSQNRIYRLQAKNHIFVVKQDVQDVHIAQ